MFTSMGAPNVILLFSYFFFFLSLFIALFEITNFGTFVIWNNQ